MEFFIKSRRVVTPEKTGPAAVHVRDGRIAGVRAAGDVPRDAQVEDIGNLALLPGVVDTHVHINEPGRAEWEGFESATRAAAAGGVTTLIDMPLNSIPATTTAAACEAKVAAAQGRCFVDVGFWGGVVPGNSAHLAALWKAGVFGFKCFLCPSGVEEFPFVREPDLRAALPELKKLGARLLVHAETPEPIDHAVVALGEADRAAYSTWLKARPREAENEAIAMMIGMCAEFRVPVHIVHLSSSDALLLIKWAEKDGLPLTVETCPHYLTFTSEEIGDGATEFKCAPPIREKANRERLWGALLEGVIDLVASDHSPCPPQMKQNDTGDFFRAWGGVASLQISLPALWTAARGREVSLNQVARWMCSEPARLAGLEKQKGAIAEGCDADFVVLDPEAEWPVEPEKLFHRHKLTPYAGRTLRGSVRSTYLRGEKIFDSADFPLGARGAILRRTS